jgi:hypothetical protein
LVIALWRLYEMREYEGMEHTQGKTPEDGLSRNAINVRVKQLGKLIDISREAL